ncbi:MAG TPA: fumarate hydratase [Clostridiales bacterium UBA8960]|jgi:fumarate hydratase subunit alpha|nr:fumarate hydratase [Clostridiales bacterium UBA8960]
MRQIHVNEIVEAVSAACIEMNYVIDKKIEMAFKSAIANETSVLGKTIISDLLQNAEKANGYMAPLCQDTGMVVAFVKIGQEIHIEGGGLEWAIQEGIRKGYDKGYLRKSVVKDPLLRINTNDNTPGIVYYEIVEGAIFEIDIAAKGFGSENMSRSKMLKPSDGIKGVIDFVLETVDEAGSNPCPPIVVGVGIGGTLDKAAQIAKKALLRDLNEPSSESHLAELEHVLLNGINNLGIGPQGLGGNTTALAVHVEAFPTHIAGLPVVVNINCHASRHHKVVF